MEQYSIKAAIRWLERSRESGAKNSALGILTAAITCDERVTIRNYGCE